MNLLYLCHRLPYPPNKGEKIRALQQLRYLTSRHTIHLACFVDTYEDFQYVKELEQYCASVEVVHRSSWQANIRACGALFTSRPLSVASFYSATLAGKITARLRSEPIDRILIFSSAMAVYVQHITGIPKVMDFVDADSEKWRLFADYHSWPMAWLYRLEARRLSRYEVAVARSVEQSVFVNDREASLVQGRVPERPITVVPNGVDLEYFTPAAPADTPLTPCLVFTGVMDYFPNIDAVEYFCREVFPLVRQALPETTFYIVGRNPIKQVKQLAQQPNVIVTGAVPDVRPYLAQAQVAVAPLRIARGVQNKILEAMAMGVPVVGTSAALEGTWATTGDGVRLADAPGDFARALLALLTNRALQRQCAIQARRYVEEHHQWDRYNARLDALLHQAVPAPETL